MELKVKRIDIEVGGYEVILNEEDAKELGLHPQDRAKIGIKGKLMTAIVNISQSMIKPGEVGMFVEISEKLNVKNGDKVKITPTTRPQSVDYIKKKIFGEKLTKDEIYGIIKDISDDNLSLIELTSYVTAIQIRGMDMDETEWTTMAMVESGDTLDFEYTVFDVHSIGGVPGNKYAPIAVPIAASLGLKIPKTSSRAISSAAGTADLMEVLTHVDLKISDIKRIVDEVGATLAWGGAVNLAPADDKIVHVEYPLGIDPHSQVLASVMAKKKAVGANFMVLDIPMGPETKVPDERTARKYAMDFIELGSRLGITVEAAVTYGGQPVGRAIGPALEAKEAMIALEGKPVSTSLLEKATDIAGMLLELGNIAERGEGKDMAREALKAGKAREKFLEIINAQGSRGIEKSDDVPVGKYKADIHSPEEGYISIVSNKALVRIARTAGAPKDKGAGILLNKKKSDKVEKGEVLYTIYADSKAKLEEAVKVAKMLKPLQIEGMLLERIPSYKR